MFYKIVNESDWKVFQSAIQEGSLKELKNLGEEYRKSYALLANSIREQITLLDEFYGKERKEEDLGGLAYCFITVEDYERFIAILEEKYHIQKHLSEYIDIITETNEFEMIQELFIISNDFAIIMIYPKKK